MNQHPKSPRTRMPAKAVSVSMSPDEKEIWDRLAHAKRDTLAGYLRRVQRYILERKPPELYEAREHKSDEK